MVGKALAALIALPLALQPAAAADIAVDVASGAILTATDADAPRLPASLTKLMTAYVAFEALAAGEIAAETKVTVSHFAAGRPPVKLRLRKGSTIDFAEVLGAAIVGSKNDAAVVVAEAVADSESAFVERMNTAASRLGMTNTRFVNATGLPAPDQQTTARDMALLSRALLTQFPARSTLFSNRSVTALGRRVSTTNPLFGRVKGSEGLKTGFTCAGGYSIAALVERDGKRVVAITLGHKTKKARLRAARGLIDAAFRLSTGSGALASGPRNGASPPDIGACAAGTATVIASDIPPDEMALYAAELAKARRRIAVAAQPPDPAPIVRPAPIRRAPPPPLSGWAVFLGAHPTEEVARSELRAVFGIGLTRGTARTERRRRDGRILALIYGLDRPTATAMCKARSAYCLALAPARLLNPRAQWRR